MTSSTIETAIRAVEAGRSPTGALRILIEWQGWATGRGEYAQSNFAVEDGSLGAEHDMLEALIAMYPDMDREDAKRFDGVVKKHFEYRTNYSLTQAVNDLLHSGVSERFRDRIIKHATEAGLKLQSMPQEALGDRDYCDLKRASEGRRVRTRKHPGKERPEVEAVIQDVWAGKGR